MVMMREMWNETLEASSCLIRYFIAETKKKSFMILSSSAEIWREYQLNIRQKIYFQYRYVQW